ncbi:MAG: hypothetical protein ACI9UT_001107 [Flavobacteriales bacterium]|jgi:hypothetical protein
MIRPLFAKVSLSLQQALDIHLCLIAVKLKHENVRLEKPM